MTKFITEGSFCPLGGVIVYLFECIACDGLESLFYVDGLLCAGLKVWDVILALAPGLCSLSGYLRDAK